MVVGVSDTTLIYDNIDDYHWLRFWVSGCATAGGSALWTEVSIAFKVLWRVVDFDAVPLHQRPPLYRYYYRQFQLSGVN